MFRIRGDLAHTIVINNPIVIDVYKLFLYSETQSSLNKTISYLQDKKIKVVLKMELLIRAKRVSNCYIPPKKIRTLCVCSINLGFSGVVNTLLLLHVTTV